jgi:hypothetical protein
MRDRPGTKGIHILTPIAVYSAGIFSAVLLVAACAPATSPTPASASEQPEQAAPTPEVVYTTFGEIAVNGESYERDIVIENGKVRERDKGPSRDEREKYGHTPLTTKESIPWECKTLVIGTGMHGRLPVVTKFKEEAERRNVKLIILKTKEAVKYFCEHFSSDVNAIFHVTC